MDSTNENQSNLINQDSQSDSFIVNNNNEQNQQTAQEEDFLNNNEVKDDFSTIEKSENQETIQQESNETLLTANNSELEKKNFSESDVLGFLKEKGIEVDSLNSIKNTYNDKDINLFKKYKEVVKDSSIEDFIYAKEIANKKWEETDKPDLVARYLSEVEEISDDYLSRKLKKLTPLPIMTEEDFFESDNNGEYSDYVDSIKDSNMERQIEFNRIYKQSLAHFKNESSKYKDIFNSDPPKDTTEDYFVGLAKSIDTIEDIIINDNKLSYTKEEKDFMLNSAQNINALPEKYFNQNGTAKDSKKVLQDFAWLDESFRNNKLKQTYQIAFNAGKEAMIKNKSNITFDKGNVNPIGNMGTTFEDMVKSQLTNF